MITNIHIENFKSLSDISLEFSNLNVITGINGMGKSSLIQVLLLLRQTYLRDGFRRNIIPLRGDLTDNLGLFKDVLYKNHSTSHLLFEIHFDQKPLVWALHKGLFDDVLQGGMPKNQSLSEISLFSDNHFQYISASRINPNSEFKRSGENLAYKQFGKNGEYAIQYLHEKGNEEDALFSDDFDTHTQKPLPLINQVNYWLKHITPNATVDTGIKTETEYELKYRFFNEVKKGFDTFSAINSAFGLTFALPIITALLAAEKGDLIILENPESDLHPKAQSLIGQLIARAAAEGVQIIVETHSDHIINGICVAIHQQKLSSENTRIYYFHKNENEQNVNAYLIPIKENGRIDDRKLRRENIEGFFDQLEKDVETILFEN